MLNFIVFISDTTGPSFIMGHRKRTYSSSTSKVTSITKLNNLEYDELDHSDGHKNTTPNSYRVLTASCATVYLPNKRTVLSFFAISS